MAAKPTPIALLGALPAHRAAVIEALKPDYEVTIVGTKESNVPALISSVFSVPPDRRPAAIIMGGGFTQSEFEAARAAHPGTHSVPWFRTQKQVDGPPPPDVLAKWVRASLDEHDLKGGSWTEGFREGDVWSI